MEIKEAQEIVRNMESEPNIEKVYVAFGTILDAVKDGYVLCQGNDLGRFRSEMASLLHIEYPDIYTQYEVRRAARVILDHFDKILKEACL